ncbi:MAG: Crp/Fnr family transcriptional regulator [Sphaerochaetaceae bacterium]|jgi:CRP/FNR family transcriptional regulator|nr:Crp/Fnr family transcriptional regulator [Sphaerochaetaceae bacterium]MDX9938412.1 Crp/Fnr family transcriptional regulator [Sphaerochaetaceae bacterium]
MNCACLGHGPYNCIDIVPIFSHLTHDEMEQVASITREKTFSKGEAVYRVGDIRGELYVLHTGLVKVYRLSSDGKEQVIRTVGPGQFLGELSLFSAQHQTDSAIALESSRMCVIAWDRLRNLMERIPSIAFKVMEQLSDRLEQTESLLEQTNLLSVEQRLARYLLETSGERDSFVLNLSKGDLASLLGMTQETLSRRLSSFQAEGLLALEGQRGIHILDRASLERYVENPW